MGRPEQLTCEEGLQATEYAASVEASSRNPVQPVLTACKMMPPLPLLHIQQGLLVHQPLLQLGTSLLHYTTMSCWMTPLAYHQKTLAHAPLPGWGTVRY